jgi:hypothetical protein
MKGALGILGYFVVMSICCGGIYSCGRWQERKEYEKDAAAIESFLGPSEGVVEIVGVRVEHQLTVKGRYADSDLVYTVESPATGGRRACKIDLVSAGPPAMGETWRAVVSRDGNRAVVRFTRRVR